MIDFLRKYKSYIIIVSIVILIFGSWYFLMSRKMRGEPERADLVLNAIFLENVGI
ncbi:hypothetical protein [Clostridium formicaceticum]|uniref:Uncharacterized protein n=1 Tax=Clostridium formicaceticum TaxID=1497 RepID=A0AAC9RHP9_9CLOT|nr:hypothetical protein [Clostridium formicaceticum]ARE87216.1 hypothetical protein CLFO_16150 [Clostridium formicaceticum]